MSLPRWFAPPRILPPINSIDRHRLRQEYLSQTENWHNFESAVRTTVHHLTTAQTSCDSISTCVQVEQAVRQLCQAHFPRVHNPRLVCTQVKSMAAQMWYARRQLLRLRSVTLQAVFRAWTCIHRFEKLHHAIRRQSRQSRRTRLEAFLADSVPMVLQNRMHDWYKRVRTLCPKQKFRRIQMYDLHGAPLSQAQEFERLTTYFQDLFKDTQAPISTPPALTDLPFTEADVLNELRHLPVTKALAPDGFPALIWRHFADILTPVVFPCIQHAWCSTQSQPPPHWSAGWIHLLAKPNKTPNKPEALRPICLQHPMNKVMSGIHCRLLMAHAHSSLGHMPLYAYMPHRGTRDCLLTVSRHCRLVRELCTVHRKNDARSGLWGGLQISLDMEKAFDTISRQLVSRALHAFDVSADLQSLVHSWLTPHMYYIPHKEVIGPIQATGGIKQGSKDAPLFWNLTMYLILHDLLAQYDHAWIIDHLVVYADDFHMRWVIHSTADGLRAMHDMSFLMRVFGAYGLKINPSKSFAMLRLVGKALPSFQKRWICRSADGPLLRLPDMAIQVPLVAKTSYLGAIISYRAWESDTIRRRITAAQTCFHILRRWLLDKHHPIHTRIRLYRQCVLPTVLYGVFEMGMTYHGCTSIMGMINKHLRSIAHAPVHLTRVPTQVFFNSLGLPAPWTMLQNHFDRLVFTLARRRSHLQGVAMSSEPQDAGVHVPDYPVTSIPIPQPHTDPCTQVPVLKCHECHRAFTQAGPYKRHLREQHQIPCNQEDLYNPFRDTTNGYPTCRHCSKKFTDFYRLRDHINKRVCLQFHALQDQIVPICDRPDLRMHLRYKSIPGLLLNQALMKELSQHCAYCHSAIAARSMRKHYRDCHAHLLPFEPMHKDQVHGLANLGSGKGTCILCDQSCTNVRTHQCGVLLQLSILLGQTYDVSHFPVMPVMMRGDLDEPPEDDIDRPDPMPVETKSMAAAAVVPTDSTAPQEHGTSSHDLSSKPSCLHKCTQCQMAFLTQSGLAQHIQHAHLPGSASERACQDHRKPGRQKSIQQMLQAPYCAPPHAPLKQYECPLCQVTVGRKALWAHLKKDHQATKQDAFDFVPERDMLPGSLTCSHCFCSFTMEQALVTHFKRGSCPALICEWASRMHFGLDTPSNGPASQTTSSLPVLPHRYFVLPRPGLIGSARTVSVLDLVNCWFPMLYAPTLYPTQQLQWFDQTVQWLAHFPELPQTRFVTDQVFSMIHALRDRLPIHWAWTLDNDSSPCIRFDQHYIHDNYTDQLSMIKQILACIVQILARNSDLQSLSSADHGTPDWRRPIVLGSAGCLLRWLPQAPEDRHIIQWSTKEWPGAAKEELQLLCQHLGWSRRSSPDGRDDLLLMVARLTLRQEDTLNQLSLDTSMMVFLQCGRGSIMPSLLETGRIWNSQRQNGDVSTSLRQTMFLTVFQELIHRASKLQLTKPDDALVLGLKAKGILTEDHKWHYLTWNSEAKALLPNQKTPLTSDEICATLQRIHQLGQNPALILKFAALRQLKQDSLPQDTAVAIPWRLDVSLRGPEALELHTLLLKLAGNGITQLVLMRMRQSNLQRSPLATAISQRLRKS